jgi:hypothetical protein
VSIDPVSTSSGRGTYLGVIDATDGTNNIVQNLLVSKAVPFFVGEASGGRGKSHNVGIHVINGNTPDKSTRSLDGVDSLTDNPSYNLSQKTASNACQDIIQACQNAGYVAGKGLLAYCVSPIMKGVSSSTLPVVGATAVTDCQKVNRAFYDKMTKQ